MNDKDRLDFIRQKTLLPREFVFTSSMNCIDVQSERVIYKDGWKSVFSFPSEPIKIAIGSTMSKVTNSIWL